METNVEFFMVWLARCFVAVTGSKVDFVGWNTD